MQETVDAVALQLGYRDIIVVPDLRKLPTLWVRSRDLNGLIGLQMRRNLLLRRNRLLKQTTDHLIALPLALLSAPIIALLALWIRAVSGGSPFYAQVRAGKHGRPIKVWKLRTMYADAEARLEQHLAERSRRSRRSGTATSSSPTIPASCRASATSCGGPASTSCRRSSTSFAAR